METAIVLKHIKEYVLTEQGNKEYHLGFASLLMKEAPPPTSPSFQKYYHFNVRDQRGNTSAAVKNFPQEENV